MLPKHHRSEQEMPPLGVSWLHLPGLPQIYTRFGVSQANLQGGSPSLWGPSPGAWNGGSPCPLPSCSQVLPRAQVGSDGEDAGHGGDDTAHVGEEGQVLLVYGVHLHRGNLGPRDRSGLASVPPPRH